ncbi:hypothetical protein AAH979_41830 [Plantactinospora sp. ZYX-F-223]|uniref:hypothetical protein n=1 Tax=Plantactinospora sp. ZYX-F-223 TaxID=3144103 RepID=UPI0031FE3DFE
MGWPLPPLPGPPGFDQAGSAGVTECRYRRLLLSKEARLSTMADWWVRTQRTRWSTASARERPSAVSSYSTRGATSAAARAVEHLRLIAAGLHIATVRTQLNLSLVADFESFTSFTPADRHTAALHQLLTEVIAWTQAVAPLRAA